MKKRFILTICTMVMLIAMMIPLTVGASAGSGVQIECTVTAQTETSVTIDVSVTSNPGFMYLELTKNFPSEFTLTSIMNGSVISDLTKGTKYIWIADDDVTSTGTLCTLVFSIPEGTAPGNYTVSLGVGMCGNYDEESVDVSVSSCTVTVACKHKFTQEDTTYLKSEATCTSPAVYYKSCAICGEKGSETFEHGSTAPHSYTKQVTTDAYKKSSASCTAKAVYYYCCATCDAKGTNTYEYGTTLSHNYTRKVVTDTYKKSSATCTDAAVYYYCCATCDAKGTTTYTNGSELGHTGGTATCTAKAECTRCHQSYGSMLEHVYTDQDATAAYLKSAATCTSKAVYYKNCATCDKAGTATFEYGSTETHSYTKKVTTDSYKKSSASCTAKAVYYFCCATCDAKGTETYESGSTLAHNYTRKVVTDTYKKSSATCTDAAVYYYCCATCDAKGTTTYTNGSELGHTGGTATCTAKAECTRCHQSYGSMLEHVYTDQDATAAYLKSAATCTSKAVYYKNCATCDKAGTATFEHGDLIAHDYEDSWSTDDSGHWHKCSKCDDKKDFGAHSSDIEWQKDDTHHWHKCSACSYEPLDKTEHSYGAWTVTKPATSTSEGEKERVCTCGYKDTEVISKTPAASGGGGGGGGGAVPPSSGGGGGAPAEPEKHDCSGGTATCKAKAKCATCGKEYGELADHTYSEATCKAKAKCSVCGIENGDFGSHKDADNNNKCDVCEFDMAPATTEPETTEPVTSEPETTELPETTDIPETTDKVSEDIVETTEFSEETTSSGASGGCSGTVSSAGLMFITILCGIATNFVVKKDDE